MLFIFNIFRVFLWTVLLQSSSCELLVVLILVVFYRGILNIREGYIQGSHCRLNEMASDLLLQVLIWVTNLIFIYILMWALVIWLFLLFFLISFSQNFLILLLWAHIFCRTVVDLLKLFFLVVLRVIVYILVFKILIVVV